MAPFRFSLQQVLNYREQLRDQAQIELARVMTLYQQEQAREVELRRLLDSEGNRLYTLPPHESGQRWLLELFLRGLREDLAITSARVKKLAEDVHHAKLVLAVKAKDHKILEKLKSKQAERHAHDEQSQEQKDYDETAAIRYKVQPV